MGLDLRGAIVGPRDGATDEPAPPWVPWENDPGPVAQRHSDPREPFCAYPGCTGHRGRELGHPHLPGYGPPRPEGQVERWVMGSLCAALFALFGAAIVFGTVGWPVAMWLTQPMTWWWRLIIFGSWSVALGSVAATIITRRHYDRVDVHGDGEGLTCLFVVLVLAGGIGALAGGINWSRWKMDTCEARGGEVVLIGWSEHGRPSRDNYSRTPDYTCREP